MEIVYLWIKVFVDSYPYYFPMVVNVKVSVFTMIEDYCSFKAEELFNFPYLQA